MSLDDLAKAPYFLDPKAQGNKALSSKACYATKRKSNNIVLSAVDRATCFMTCLEGYYDSGGNAVEFSCVPKTTKAEKKLGDGDKKGLAKCKSASMV